MYRQRITFDQDFGLPHGSAVGWTDDNYAHWLTTLRMAVSVELTGSRS
jgi:hypothetical protein